MLALPQEKFLQRQKPSRQIIIPFRPDEKSNNYYRHSNKPYIVQLGTAEELRHSFFPRTAIDWNKLENIVLHADSVGSFRMLVSKTSHQQGATQHPAAYIRPLDEEGNYSRSRKMPTPPSRKVTPSPPDPILQSI